MAQDRRSQILKGFLEGKYSAIVATGVLARGLDLKNVQQVYIIIYGLCVFLLSVFVAQVLVFDLPSSVAEFVHQVIFPVSTSHIWHLENANIRI